MTGSANEALLQAALKVWPLDHEPVRWDVEAGIVWAIAHSPSIGMNGYVLIPAEGHPWSTGWPRIDDDGWSDAVDVLDVHGGVTYAAHPWIGFDTGHAFDVWDEEYDHVGITKLTARHPTTWDRQWTPILVAEETKRLARQLAAIGAAHPKGELL